MYTLGGYLDSVTDDVFLVLLAGGSAKAAELSETVAHASSQLTRLSRETWFAERGRCAGRRIWLHHAESRMARGVAR